jgi:spermidine/putrescine transport system substrate-binding protein
MNDLFTRDQLLRRALAGGAFLSVPGLLAACGGGSKKSAVTSTAAAAKTLPKRMTFSNWPLYIDINEKTKSHPSLAAFDKHYGVNVKYLEDINDNDSFFGKIEGPLSQGQSIGRDLIVLTDSSGLPGRMIELGWLEKLDKSAIPNIKNLQPVQQHPSWDPNRDYSLPWQSGMTGIGYDPKLVGGDIKSVDQLLTDPKLKGKVTLLTEMADSVGLVIGANGDDPTKVTDATFKKAIDRMQAAVKSGQVRQFTGNDYAPLLAKGDVYACFAWSGDMVQLQADHPGLKWVLPDTGGMIWTDNMLIPKGGNVYGASVLMNWYYDPKIAAEVEDYVNYICPVVGADKVLLKTDPAIAKNPLIFPTKAMLANVRQFDPKALNNQDYK